MLADYDLEPDPDAAAYLVGLPVAEVERELILATLHRTEGNRTHAANILKISIRSLRNKLMQYRSDGIVIPEQVSASPAA